MTKKLETMERRPLGMGAWLTPRNMLLPKLGYRAKFGHSRSNRSIVIMEICQKMLIAHAPLFKVTQGHWNRHGSIGYL